MLKWYKKKERLIGIQIINISSFEINLIIQKESNSNSSQNETFNVILKEKDSFNKWVRPVLSKLCEKNWFIFFFNFLKIIYQYSK